MSDCPNANIRDLLPDLLHDQLDAVVRAEVDAHLSGCESCRDELVLLRSIHVTLRSERVRVDVAAIVAALPAAPAVKPDPKVVPLAARRRRFADWRIAAAATILIVGGASLAMLRDRVRPASHSAALQTAAVTSHGLTPLSPEAATSAVASKIAPQLAAPDSASATPKVIERVAQLPPGELAVNAGISDLSDDQLRSLIGSLDRIQAVPDAEPEQNPVRLPNDPGVTP